MKEKILNFNMFCYQNHLSENRPHKTHNMKRKLSKCLEAGEWGTITPT